MSAPSANSPAISIIFGPHTERYIGTRRSTPCTQYPPDSPAFTCSPETRARSPNNLSLNCAIDSVGNPTAFADPGAPRPIPSIALPSLRSSSVAIPLVITEICLVSGFDTPGPILIFFVAWAATAKAT